MNTNTIVKNLQADGQDFEYYPTTLPMLETIINDLKTNVEIGSKSVDFLDIGAGDCRLLKVLEAHKFNFCRYKVIEKAIYHIQNLPKRAVLVGTEFLETDLTNIEASICFVNPPYSAYDLWLSQIIVNAYTPLIYAIIPTRWASNDKIKQALKSRGMTANVIATSDFCEADRKARATVDILRITHHSLDVKGALSGRISKPYSLYADSSKYDPLLAELSEFSADDGDLDDWRQRELDKESLTLTFEKDKLQGLIDRYNSERASLLNDISAVRQVSPRLFKLFKIDGKVIVEKLRSDLHKLKNNYWHAFFNCYEPITKRLTKASREKLQRELGDSKNLDFTYSNCQAVTLFAIQNANSFFDEQIIALFEKHADKDNLQCYKSNQRVLENRGYRYTKDELKELYHHTKLDYRLIANYHGNHWYSDFARFCNYQDVINDYVVVARTLGFDVPDYSIATTANYMDFGKTIQVTNDKDDVLLFDIKFFKKGTYHIRLNQEFCLRLNVAVGKLFNWLNTPDDLSELGDDVDDRVWQALIYIQPSILQLEFNEKVV